jgi:uncharacterized protein
MAHEAACAASLRTSIKMLVTPSKPVTGFQAAFLYFAMSLGVAACVVPIANAIGWPLEQRGLLGQALDFSVTAILLCAIPPLRRFCVAQLTVPLPPSRFIEIGTVSVLQIALPLAISGALFLWATTIDPGFDYRRQLFLHESVDDLPISRSGWMVVLTCLLSWVVAPIIEELVYRGLLYRAWERQWGWIWAMLLSSAAFGLCHPTHMLSTFIGAIVFVCVLRRTQSLWGPIIVHSLFNILVSIPQYGHLLFVKPKAVASDPAGWYLEFACLAFVLIALPAYIWAARTPRQPASMGTHVST